VRRIAVTIISLLLLASCNLVEPLQVAGYKLESEALEVFQDKSQAICRAIENVGYIMPYGRAVGDDEFKITRPHWILSGPGGKRLVVPHGRPTLYIDVNWGIPADLNMLPNAVSQETVDLLAEEAKKICRIVQKEAIRQGIGPVEVKVILWDIIVGLEIEYGLYDPDRLEGWNFWPTSDCERITGQRRGKGIGLNPQGRTPGRCPSLHVPD
jgi:hypothetical protein